MKLIKHNSITPAPKSVSSRVSQFKGLSIRRDPTTPQSCMAGQQTANAVNNMVQRDLGFGKVSSAVKGSALKKEVSWRKGPMPAATPQGRSVLDDNAEFPF